MYVVCMDHVLIHYHLAHPIELPYSNAVAPLDIELESDDKRTSLKSTGTFLFFISENLLS